MKQGKAEQLSLLSCVQRSSRNAGFSSYHVMPLLVALPCLLPPWRRKKGFCFWLLLFGSLLWAFLVGSFWKGKMLKRKNAKGKMLKRG
jgi:hypothetical protein